MSETMWTTYYEYKFYYKNVHIKTYYDVHIKKNS